MTLKERHVCKSIDTVLQLQKSKVIKEKIILKK